MDPREAADIGSNLALCRIKHDQVVGVHVRNVEVPEDESRLWSAIVFSGALFELVFACGKAEVKRSSRANHCWPTIRIGPSFYVPPLIRVKA